MARNDSCFSSRLSPLLLTFAPARGLDFKALTAKYKLPEDLELDTPRPIELTTGLSTMRALAEDIAAQLADERSSEAGNGCAQDVMNHRQPPG